MYIRLESVPNIAGAFHVVGYPDRMLAPPYCMSTNRGQLLALYSKGGYVLITDEAAADEVLKWLHTHGKLVGQVELP